MSPLIWVLISFFILVQIPIFLQWSRFCFSNYDLGIYSQALANIRWTDLNPWISVRELRIFNDHFDPILIPLAPLARIADPTLIGLIIESGCFLAAALVMYVWAIRNHLGSFLASGLAAIILFSSASLNALTFPTHPTSWSIFAWVLLGLTFHRFKSTSRSKWFFYGAVLFLQFFREENAFFTLVLGALLFIERRTRKTGVIVSVFSAAWIAFVFVGRQKLLGPTSEYGHSITAQILNDPIRSLFTPLFTLAPWKSTAITFAPFLPFLIQNPKIKSVQWEWLLAAAPLMMIRLIANRWGQHYGIAILGGFLGAFLPLFIGLKEDSFLKKRVIASIALLVLINLGFFGHFTGRTYRNTTQHCIQSSERKTEWAKTLETIKTLPTTLPLFATGDLVPPLLHTATQRAQTLHHWGAMPSSFEPGEKILVIETSPQSRFWPVDRASLDSVRSEKLFSGQFFEVLRIK